MQLVACRWRLAEGVEARQNPAAAQDSSERSCDTLSHPYFWCMTPDNAVFYISAAFSIIIAALSRLKKGLSAGIGSIHIQTGSEKPVCRRLQASTALRQGSRLTGASHCASRVLLASQVGLISALAEAILSHMPAGIAAHDPRPIHLL